MITAAPTTIADLKRHITAQTLTLARARVAELTDRVEQLTAALEQATLAAEMWHAEYVNSLEYTHAAIDLIARTTPPASGDKVTHANGPDAPAAKLPLAVMAYLRVALKDHPFVTIGKIAQACGMVPLTATDEALLRKALEDAGCVKAKRIAGDGTRQWGYLSPYHPSVATVLPSALREPPAAPDTPRPQQCASPGSVPSANQAETPPAAPQPAAPLAPTEPGQSALAPCSAPPECGNGSVQTEGVDIDAVHAKHTPKTSHLPAYIVQQVKAFVDQSPQPVTARDAVNHCTELLREHSIWAVEEALRGRGYLIKQVVEDRRLVAYYHPHKPQPSAPAATPNGSAA